MQLLNMSILNQAAVEALCSATYLENYMETMDNLPDDLQRIVTQLRELDIQCRSKGISSIIVIMHKSLITFFKLPYNFSQTNIISVIVFVIWLYEICEFRPCVVCNDHVYWLVGLIQLMRLIINVTLAKGLSLIVELHLYLFMGANINHKRNC